MNPTQIPNKELEVIATKDGKHYIQYMDRSEWESLNKKAGYSYIAYQKGFSSYKLENVK